jgi:isopentenyl-diphosphate delta-isomerase
MSTTATVTTTESISAENILRLFPEINTDLATSAREGSELTGYDEEQVRLMDEVCIVLDEDDNPIGSASKKICMLAALRARFRDSDADLLQAI